MAKLKKARVVKMICNTCHGNGYVRVAKINGDTSVDFRNNSEIVQCEQCDSAGELLIEEPTLEFLEAMGSKRLQ